MWNGAHERNAKWIWWNSKCTQNWCILQFCLFSLCQLFTLFLLLYPLFSMNIGFSPFSFHTLQIIIISHGFVWMKDGVIVQWASCFLRNWWKSAAHLTTWCCIWGLKFQFQASSTPILSAILYQSLSRRESTPEMPLSKLTEPRGELVLKWSKWQWPMPRTRLQVWYG